MSSLYPSRDAVLTAANLAVLKALAEGRQTPIFVVAWGEPGREIHARTHDSAEAAALHWTHNADLETESNLTVMVGKDSAHWPGFHETEILLTN